MFHAEIFPTSASVILTGGPCFLSIFWRTNLKCKSGYHNEFVLFQSLFIWSSFFVFPVVRQLKLDKGG